MYSIHPLKIRLGAGGSQGSSLRHVNLTQQVLDYWTKGCLFTYFTYLSHGNYYLLANSFHFSACRFHVSLELGFTKGWS